MPNQPWGENDFTPQKQSQRQAAIRAQQVKTNRKTAGKDAPRIKIGQQTVSRVSNDRWNRDVHWQRVKLSGS